eukprot:GAHX01001782.1.p1 GENE.GAHX01001782.1~~GAHX01001782.1.p1  ORF type:complete len:486 (+),score=81.11 GAHX01001782.1:92-1549(+)
MQTDKKPTTKFDSNKEKFIIMVLLGLILPLNFPFWGFKKEATNEIIDHFNMNKEADIIKIEKWHTILNLIFCIPIIFICPFVDPTKLLLVANVLAFANETVAYFYTIKNKSVIFFYVYVIMVGFLNSLLRIFINIILSLLFVKTSSSNNKNGGVKKSNKNLNLFFSMINSMQKSYIMLTSFLIPKLVEKEAALTNKRNVLEQYYPYFYYISTIPMMASSAIYLIMLRRKKEKTKTKSNSYNNVQEEEINNTTINNPVKKNTKIIHELKTSLLASFYITVKEYEWYISGTLFTLLYLAINYRRNRYFIYGLQLETFSIENSVDNIFMFIAPAIIYYLYKVYKNNWIYMVSQGLLGMVGMMLLAFPIIFDFKSRIYTIFSLSVLGFSHILLSNTFYPMFVEIYPMKYMGVAFSVFNLFFSIMFLLLNFIIELIFKAENLMVNNSKEVLMSFIIFILLCFGLATALLALKITKKKAKMKENTKNFNVK